MRRDFKFVWVASYYDGPLSGLCRVDGRLMRFYRQTPDDAFQFYPLTPMQKVKWLLRKTLFEICVGRHWTYPNRENGCRFHWRRPVWLHKLLHHAYYRFRRGA